MEPTLDEAIRRDVQILNNLLEIAPNEVERVFPDTRVCILTARVGMETLRHFKIRRRAVPVIVTAFNKAATERIEREGHLPTSQEEIKRWSREDGSWIVGGGGTGAMNRETNSFDGHVVILAHHDDEEFDGVLLDLALGQMSRPHRDIHLEPLAATAPTGFLGGEAVVVAEMNGSIVRYRHMPEATEWTQAMDWRDPDRRAPIVARIIEKIEARLDD
jgi:hypothetical protein